MVGIQQPRNQAQKIVDQSVTGTKVDGGTVTKNFYTVPAGKKAKITSVQIAFIAFGTGTQTTIYINTVQLIQKNVTSGNMTEYLTNPVVLTAGQSVSYGGDAAGNNATINFLITYQETNA